MIIQTLFQNAARKSDHRLIKNIGEIDYRRRLMNTVSQFTLLGAVHTAAMMALEGQSLSDAIWLTVVTATTVGYGDVSAHTELGRLATTAMMFGRGIPLLANSYALWMDYREMKKNKVKDGKWSWKMKDHMVIMNAPKDGATKYFKRLMTEFRNSVLPGSQQPALIVTDAFNGGLPDDLRKLHVSHVNEVATDPVAFENSNLKDASVIVLLSPDEDNPLSDSIVYDQIARIQAINPDARIIAEAISDDNRHRFRDAGAEHVIRPLRTYPEILVRTVLAPGTEMVIEEIFNSAGSEAVRYDVDFAGQWSDVAISLIRNDIGTALGYVDKNGKVVTEIHARQQVEGQALIVLSQQANIMKNSDVQKALNADLGQVAAKVSTGTGLSGMKPA